MNLGQIAHQELKSKSGEAFSLSALLSEMAGLKDLFIHHEILPPGRRSSSKHAHSHREEFALVLEGEVIATIGDLEHRLGEGDFLGFPAGEGHAHLLENRAARTARVLVVASNPPADRVLY